MRKRFWRVRLNVYHYFHKVNGVFPVQCTDAVIAESFDEAAGLAKLVYAPRKCDLIGAKIWEEAENLCDARIEETINIEDDLKISGEKRNG